MPAFVLSARLRSPLALVLALILGGCSKGGDATRASIDADAASAGREGSTTVAVVVVRPGLESGDARHTILEPWVDAPVVARHRGIVRSVNVAEGRRVAKGAVLAHLDDDEYRLDFDRA